jgi:hypothetical protein
MHGQHSTRLTQTSHIAPSTTRRAPKLTIDALSRRADKRSYPPGRLKGISWYITGAHSIVDCWQIDCFAAIRGTTPNPKGAPAASNHRRAYPNDRATSVPTLY